VETLLAGNWSAKLGRWAACCSIIAKTGKNYKNGNVFREQKADDALR
jgi:hypothetical protein